MPAGKAAPALILVMLALSACASGHRAGARPLSGTVPSTAAETRIAQVLASKAGAGFGSFPQDELRLGCPIPSVFHTIKGTCQTRVAFRKTSHTAVVTFIEYWPSRKFRSGGSANRTLQHSWSFEVEGDGRVVALGNRGDFPPQWAQ